MRTPVWLAILLLLGLLIPSSAQAEAKQVSVEVSVFRGSVEKPEQQQKPDPELRPMINRLRRTFPYPYYQQVGKPTILAEYEKKASITIPETDGTVLELIPRERTSDGLVKMKLKWLKVTLVEGERKEKVFASLEVSVGRAGGFFLVGPKSEKEAIILSLNAEEVNPAAK